MRIPQVCVPSVQCGHQAEVNLRSDEATVNKIKAVIQTDTAKPIRNMARTTPKTWKR
jgi:2-methylisocitrate lyase-like PEP mutase family enzyme